MTRGSGINWPVIAWLALFLVFWAMVGGAFAQAVAGPDRPIHGDLVAYTDQAGHRWCARVSAFDTGVDARPWAWLTSTEGPPHALLHAPVAELRAGCGK